MSRQELLNELAKLPDAQLADALNAVRRAASLPSSESGQKKLPLREAYGLLKGTFAMSDDFDASLDLFKDYMP